MDKNEEIIKFVEGLMGITELNTEPCHPTQERETLPILRPHELPFEVPKQLETDINNLIVALETKDFDLDCFLDEVHGSARMLPEEEDRWVYEYYCCFGWMKQND